MLHSTLGIISIYTSMFIFFLVGFFFTVNCTKIFLLHVDNCYFYNKNNTLDKFHQVVIFFLYTSWPLEPYHLNKLTFDRSRLSSYLYLLKKWHWNEKWAYLFPSYFMENDSFKTWFFIVITKNLRPDTPHQNKAIVMKQLFLYLVAPFIYWILPLELNTTHQ